MNFLRVSSILCLLAITFPLRADVVINEIFYNAPDDLDNLQFIELHNTAEKPVDLTGWKFTKGIKYEFPKSSSIEGKGFLVVCKDLPEFKKYYGFDASGAFTGSLSHGGESIELSDASGKKIDSVKYKTRHPWPVAPDGCSSSLERICPTAPETGSENWTPSPMASGIPKPMGTPGRKNSYWTPHLPPTITDVTFTPTHATPDQEIKVEAEVRSQEEVREVQLRYRVAKSGSETNETSLPMTKDANGRYSATIPAQKAGQIVRFRVQAVDGKGVNRYYPNPQEIRPALSVYVHEKFEVGKIPFGFIMNVGTVEFRNAQRGEGGGQYGAPAKPSPPIRGRSAFVYVSPKTGEPELFDFISISPRNAGRKIRFHKDHQLDGMSTINLIFEYMDRFALAEPLAYEVYRKAGNAACRTDFVRTWIDGRPIGYQLLIEQPNKAFLRHNNLNADGNLYKSQWTGHNLITQHEKKTRIREGHDDLLKLMGELNKVKGEAQWTVIKKNFDVEQMINYYAVNMILSHWDGFFNNFYVYHDVEGTGKWTMYPWDQDKTWGYHDGLGEYDIFTNMPLSFGKSGDQPPNGGAFIWWRPGGAFSSPLLANPQFRKLYLARIKELLEKVYTEEVFGPIIKEMGQRLEEEVKIRAKLHGQDPKNALTHLNKNLDLLRDHLIKRRKFLLDQDEIKKVGKFDREQLK